MSITMKLLDAGAPAFAVQLRAALAWESLSSPEVEQRVNDILRDVKNRGDAAVLQWTNTFDKLNATSAGDLKKVGRVGVKSIVYFEVVTTVALILGVLVAYIFGPGHGMNVDPASLDASAMSTYVERTEEMHGAVDFLLGIVPTTLVGAFAEGDIVTLYADPAAIHRFAEDGRRLAG